MKRVVNAKTGIGMMVFILSVCLGLPATTLEAASSRVHLESAADEAYERMLAIFKKVPPDKCNPIKSNEIECNYWHLGNAFDTAIDYLRRNRRKAKTFAEVVINKYEITSITPWVCWYDDYGWWAVAAQRALDPRNRGLWTRDQRRRFEQIAAETWTSMQVGLFVWDLQQTERFKFLEPMFDGGIWNYFWSEESLHGVCQTPCDPRSRPLCGRQNTVTNGLYLLAAAIRAEQTGDAYYLQATSRQKKFLEQWFEFGLPDHPTQSLLFSLEPSSPSHGPAVVRERVSQTAGFVDTFYQADLIWAGDQGLILAGLLRMTEVVRNDKDRRTLLDLAKRITDGVLEYLLDRSDGVRFFPWSRVMHPTRHNIGRPPGNDTNDYSAGIGVYMRYLLHAYKTNKEMRRHLKNTQYPELVWQFAEFAARDQRLCYNSFDDCDDLVRNTNKLAVLVAALSMK